MILDGKVDQYPKRVNLVGSIEEIIEKERKMLRLVVLNYVTRNNNTRRKTIEGEIRLLNSQVQMVSLVF